MAKKTVELFTDGACSGNPGPGAWAFVLRHPASGKSIERAGVSDLLDESSPGPNVGVARPVSADPEPDVRMTMGDALHDLELQTTTPDDS